MKYSEAIRLGATLGPQWFGGPHGPQGELCANAGALRAVGQYDTAAAWPWSYRDRSICPVCNHGGFIAYVVAVHLNDRHHWDRDRIADWVATVEPQEQAEVVNEETRELTCV